MTHKLNCWEFKNCGREPGGILAEQLGVCPIAVQMKRDGDNSGIAAGRVCWTIPVADKNGRTPGSCADKACLQCSFYKRVHFEEQPSEENKRSMTIVGERTTSVKPKTTKAIEVA